MGKKNEVAENVKSKKSIKEIVRIALSSRLSDEQIKEFRGKGIADELSDEEMTVFLAMVYGQAQSAAFKGNTSAFDKLVTILEAEENDSRDILFELPARVLAKSFVDVNRMITAREYSEYVFKGGRLATKSSFIALKIIEIVKQNPTFHALAVRPFENTLRDSVYAQFMWAISELGDTPNWKLTTSPMQCEYLPTGQRIYLRGADDPGKIKSIKPPLGHIAV